MTKRWKDTAMSTPDQVEVLYSRPHSSTTQTITEA